MSEWRTIEGNALDVMRGMSAGEIDAIVTDPPYDVNLNKNTCGWDVWPDPAVWKEAARVTKPDGLMAVIIAPHVAHERIPDVLAGGWRVLEVGFWVWGAGRSVTPNRLKRCFDLVYFLAQTSSKLLIENARGQYASGSITNKDQSGSVKKNSLFGRQYHSTSVPKVYTYDQDYHPANVACEVGSEAFGASGYERIFAVKRMLPVGRTAETHPTQKPDDLMAQIIKLVSNEGDTVLDPFMGHGTTLKTALQLGRNAIGIDLSAEYVEAARRNIMQDSPMFNIEAVA